MIPPGEALGAIEAAKGNILASGANAAAWPLIIVLVLTSVIGLFYHLRIVATLFSDAPEGQSSMQRIEWGSAIVLGGLAVWVWKVRRACSLRPSPTP